VRSKRHTAENNNNKKKLKIYIGSVGGKRTGIKGREGAKGGLRKLRKLLL
jgi:hypothetical protein